MQLPVIYGDNPATFLPCTNKERPDAKAIEGKQALFVLNLPPRKMAGLISEGMLFDLGYADQVSPVLAVPESPIPNGTRAE
jgi:tRNA-binding protein